MDRRTGTDLWRKAIEKEMKNVMPAFEFRDDDKVPIGHKEIKCHFVFDLKMCWERKRLEFVNYCMPVKACVVSTFCHIFILNLFEISK